MKSNLSSNVVISSISKSQKCESRSCLRKNNLAATLSPCLDRGTSEATALVDFDFTHTHTALYGLLQAYTLPGTAMHGSNVLNYKIPQGGH